MQGPSLVSQLGETHGVVVYHAPSLAPRKLHAAFQTYGKPSIVRSYLLTDGNVATIVFFAEAASNISCYLSLSQLTQAKPELGMASIGWMHEKSEETFARQSYVKSKYVEAGAAVSASPAPVEAEDGYVVVYWKGVTDSQRADVTAMARQAAQEVFEDDKEGGRFFLRFSSEDVANAFHSHVLSKYDSMRRCLSYADATDFALAKKK